MCDFNGLLMRLFFVDLHQKRVKYYSAKPIITKSVSALSWRFLGTLEGGIRRFTGTFEAI